MKKVCFAASSGGHYEQLSMLEPLMRKYDSFVVTEKTSYTSSISGMRQYNLLQVNRKEKLFPVKLLANAFISLYIFAKERPDVMITTGVLSMIPMALLCKLFGKKFVYIESFAKITSPTESGKFLYRYADRFYVQWEPMLEYYPDAINMGSIY